jgi:hypothetical protein
MIAGASLKKLIPCTLLFLAACSPPPPVQETSSSYRVTFQDQELAPFKLNLTVTTEKRGSFRAVLQNCDPLYTVHNCSMRIKTGDKVRICNVDVEVKPRSVVTFYMTNVDFSVPDEYRLLQVEASRDG